jgi:hypothetical protein
MNRRTAKDFLVLVRRSAGRKAEAWAAQILSQNLEKDRRPGPRTSLAKDVSDGVSGLAGP